MKQYCRYCSNLVVGDAPYCDVLKDTIRESKAKRVNNCPSFDFNPIDAFYENKRGYQPRGKKQKIEGQGRLAI